NLRGGGPHDRDEGSDIDHRAASALQQVRDAVLAAEEDTLRVDVLHPLPCLDARLEHGRVVGGRDAGIVVEHVDAAKALGRLGVYVRNSLLVGDVDLYRERLARTERDRLFRRLGVYVRDTDTGPLPGEENRRLAAHAAARTRDDRHLVI